MDANQKRRSRMWRMLLLAAMVILVAAAMGLLGRALPAGEWRSEPVHSSIEALGALAAVLLGLFLLYREPAERDVLLPTVALGFVGMGFLDAFHAASVPGQGFVLLRVSAGLIGGLGFALA